MNVGRAKEIMESADNIKVTYEGSGVIIQNVDEKQRTARIYWRESPEQERTVPVLNLIEEVD
ncbi:H-type small acid-soluble spore protein [Neobacillus piezotolerans]|uniref:Small, acid-soluble spore protein H n=1 Tax=Neobacillus piezotolerans TaxID=2259171 RepID=A0A3D8GSK3_9BACI|nr:H-type small acid-soluble spore protein [Neobacillus piezotolerans]RDU37453.1 H-type small acid-soluble spore protein [Neobacillus piezotolerans]